MTPTPVRIFGDPFASHPASVALRSFLRLAMDAGWACALDLAAARGDAPGPGRRRMPLTDGVRDLEVHTALESRELALLFAVAEGAVPATAPVLAFDMPGGAHVAWAELAWPEACAVLDAMGRPPADLLVAARAAVEVAGTGAGPQDPAILFSMAELRPWLALPAPLPNGHLLHVGAGEPDGTDLVLRAVAGPLADLGRELVCVPGDALRPESFAAAAAVLMPLRRLQDPRVLPLALASGRPVVISRFSATAPLIPDSGLCHPIGGKVCHGGEGQPARYEPEPSGLVHGVRAVVENWSAALAMGRRARAHVQTHHLAPRPAAAPARTVDLRSPRPSVVLEAPWFETSSAAELSIETARAMLDRGEVDLSLVPSGASQSGPESLRRRAPELLGCLARRPDDVDLWLSAGWPPRPDRPRASTFALRVDWEYGALPLELCPHVTQEADCVVVHSHHVLRTVAAAGRSPETIALVPHGVDGDMFVEEGPTLGSVLRFKAGRPAVLFVGGLIWRKGIDLYLGALLQAVAAGQRPCAVIKAVGGASHYAGYHLGALVDRFRSTPGAPDVLVIEDELSRPELAALYRSCDVLLHPYRGEGFGMPVLEARACGLPVVVTAGGSTDDFCDGPGAVRIPAARRALSLPGPHVGQPWVLEPDADAAARGLVESLGALSRLREDARASAAELRRRYTWAGAAHAIERLARAAMGRRPRRHVSRIATPPC